MRHILSLLMAISFCCGSEISKAQDSPLKDLNGYFPMEVPETLEQWEVRKAELKRQVQVAVGLWPMPEKTPLNAVIHSPVKRDGVIIERVYFESMPGLYVTGQLFRPAESEGPLPVVLSPHGHGGRYFDEGSEKVLERIVKGQERFESSGRMPKVARCVKLARMGCLVLLYDMMGYGDNMQLSHELTHGFKVQRPGLNSPDRFGLFSAQAEMRLLSVMGIQTWNSIRALDFLLEHPLADPNKVGVTGGSGGGTQSILLCALDDRPDVAFPQGMVSTSMQGGCTCENASLLRIGTGNVELAALFAPKPQAMTAADDWTIDMMTKGYPQLKAVYELYGKGTSKLVQCTDTTHYPHNYNYPTRALMYDWFNRHLELGFEWPIVEEDYELMSDAEMRVWTEDHPAPQKTGEEFEVLLLREIAQADQKYLSSLSAQDGRQSELGQHVLPALQAILGMPAQIPQTTSSNNYDAKEIIIELSSDDSPMQWLEEPQAFFKSIGMKQGAVITVDDQSFQWNPVVANPRQAPCYTYCYNQPILVQRVHQVLNAIEDLIINGVSPEQISLTSDAQYAPVALMAATMLQQPIGKLKLSLLGFRFEQITHYRDLNFLPGAIKYGDVPVYVGLANARVINVIDKAPLPKVTQQLLSTQKNRILIWKQ